MTFRRIVASLLLATGALVVSAVPAAAHTELKSSNPPAGATLDAAPTQLELTFTEPVTGPSIQVASPEGAWTVGTPSVAGPVVTVPVTPAGPAGQHTITWKVVSADGDPVSGTVAFTLSKPVAAPTTTVPPTTTTTSAAASSTPAPAASEDGGGLPVWAWVVIGLGVVALAVGGFLVSRRQSA